MEHFLQKTSPLSLEKLLLTILSGSFLTFSLYVYQAYNIQSGLSYSGHSLFFRAVSFGVLTSICFLFNEYFFYKKILNKNWWLWRLWELWLGGTATFLLFNFFWNWQEWFIISYVQILLEYSAVIVIPIIVSYFIKKYAIQLQSLSENVPSVHSLHQNITFISTNQKQKLTLPIEDFLYATTADNYIEIHYVEALKLKKMLIRITMKDLENQFQDYGFVRCHRSYFINTNNIRQVKRHNQKLEVGLNHVEYLIPVSKKYQGLSIWANY